MLCTVIWDAYASGERVDVHAALATLLGGSTWSRKGVYAYWHPRSHDLLYLGLASDLSERFAQHSGLKPHAGGNKKKEIDDYFSYGETLGFSIVIQSADVAIADFVASLNPLLATPADELIAVGEGQLIEMHRLVTGTRPPWNKKGGAKAGARFATEAPALLDVLAARRDSLFVARRSLRDLAQDETAEEYEVAIHTGRMRAVMEAHGVMLVPKPSRGASEETVREISRGLLLQAGHLVDELDASDEQIVSWMRRVSDDSYWREEQAQARAMLDKMRAGELDTPDRMINDLLDGIFSGAAPPERAEMVERVFASGYLDEKPRLRAVA